MHLKEVGAITLLLQQVTMNGWKRLTGPCFWNPSQKKINNIIIIIFHFAASYWNKQFILFLIQRVVLATSFNLEAQFISRWLCLEHLSILTHNLYLRQGCYNIFQSWNTIPPDGCVQPLWHDSNIWYYLYVTRAPKTIDLIVQRENTPSLAL